MRSLFSAALAVIAVAATPAAAAVRTDIVNLSFAGGLVAYGFGGGNNIIFSVADPAPFALDPAAIQTRGAVEIASLGAPFFDPVRPTSYFPNRGGSIGPDLLAQFVPYASPAAIPFSITESIVGLRFDLGQGFQYGYADIVGTTLLSVSFETTSGVAIAIGGGNVGAVPEPATWALLIGGFGITGMALRRRRAVAA